MGIAPVGAVVAGRLLRADVYKRQVLFQDGALFSSLSVGENVLVPLNEHHPELPDLSLIHI